MAKERKKSAFRFLYLVWTVVTKRFFSFSRPSMRTRKAQNHPAVTMLSNNRRQAWHWEGFRSPKITSSMKCPHPKSNGKLYLHPLELWAFAASETWDDGKQVSCFNFYLKYFFIIILIDNVLVKLGLKKGRLGHQLTYITINKIWFQRQFSWWFCVCPILRRLFLTTAVSSLWYLLKH